MHVLHWPQIGYSGYTSLYLIFATITALHTNTCVNQYFFSRITKYRKMMFLFTWNRANLCVTA